MANKDIVEMWLQGIESAMQKMHSPDNIRDVDLTMVNGMMVRTGIKSGPVTVGTATVDTTEYGNAPVVSYESGACASYATGACASYSSGACLASPVVEA
jgi:2',3'-cyclic-nucleotide 2'-phosphodiesterase (5'-nucleotidase family)